MPLPGKFASYEQQSRDERQPASTTPPSRTTSDEAADRASSPSRMARATVRHYNASSTAPRRVAVPLSRVSHSRCVALTL
jgi:hypothetical protein